MEKIKLLIELDKDNYKRVMMFPNALNSYYCQAIRNGIPYNPSGDCISRSDLRKTVCGMNFDFGDYYDNTDEIIDRVCETIDNAQTVEITEEQAINKLHETGWLIEHDKEMTTRPQDECCDSCYLCDVGNCDVTMQKGGAE